MKRFKMKQIGAILLAFAMIITSLGMTETSASAASNSKVVKNVTLKIGNKNVTQKTYSMTKGKTGTIKVVVKPAASKKSVSFQSSNKKIITVSKTGKLTAKKAGTAKVTVTVTDKKGKKKNTWVKIKVKKKKDINSKKPGADKSDTSDDTDNSSANEGNNVSNSSGSSTSSGGGGSSSPGKEKVNIEVMASYGGSVNTTGGKYNAKEKISLKATPNNGWVFSKWSTTNGGTLSNEKSITTDFSATKDATVVAVFEKEGQSELSDDELSVYEAYHALQIEYAVGDYADSVTKDVGLPTSVKTDAKVTIKWESNDERIINSEGKVTRPDSGDKAVALTAKVCRGDYSHNKQFTVLVKKKSNVNVDNITNNRIVDIYKLNGGDKSKVEITYDDDENYVESIDGKFSDQLVDSAESAINAIYSVRTLIGVNSPNDELVCKAENHDEASLSYSFSQEYNGIPVYGTSVTVTANPDTGEVQSLHSSYVPDEKLSRINLTPTLSKEQIKAMYEGAKSCTPSIYAIKEYGNDPILVYVLTTDSEVIIANANDGNVVLRFPTAADWGDYSTTGTGKTENGDLVTFPVQFHQLDFYFFYQEDVEKQIYVKGDKSSAITHEFNTEWGDATANSAYTNTIKVYDWYKDHLNRNSIDNNGMPIIVNVHAGGLFNFMRDNAFWDGESISFLDNSSEMNEETSKTTASGLDITAHEITHGVLEKIVLQGRPREEKDTIFPYADETGAINEGYADVFGYFVDNSNWTMGEEWKTIRSLSNPGLYGAPTTLDDPNYYKVTADLNSDEYKKQESAFVHINSSLVYHAAYLMHTYGITGSKLEKLWYNSMSKGYDATADFYTVRQFLILAAKATGLSDTEIANVRKAFDTEKIFDERGSIKVNLQDADGNQISVDSGDVQYSLVRDRKDVPENEYVFNQPGASGIEKSDIYFGTYKINVSAPGYVPFEGSIEIEKNKTSEITVTLVKAGNGKAGGVITSATTGHPVPDADLKVRGGWNTKSGSIIAESATDENGNYVFEMPAGNYTIEMSKDSYNTGYLNIVVDGSKEILDQNASISPIIEFGDNFRVVLSWGENPRDLDSHLVGKSDGQYSYHVYFRKKNGYDNNGNEVANLDVDDTTSYGPETVTFTASADGSYEYYVDWYAGTGTWAASGAKVEVYSGNSDEAIYVFDVPNWDYSEGKWSVFTYKNGILKKSY